MKILFVHTFYTQKGGEDAVFYQEVNLIRQVEEVRVLNYYNKKGLHGALQFLLSIWNNAAARQLKELIRDFKPDVIHMHNIHFAIGPIAIRVAKKAGIPIVLTLHNFRLLCPSGTLLFNENIFLDSVKSTFPWQAIKKKVFRNSLILTFWLAFVTWFHRKIGTWKMVDKYIVLTSFAKQVFMDSSLGIPENKFSVKSNFVDQSLAEPVVRNTSFLFVGRLAEEKGIKVLLETFKQVDFELKIAGGGPLEDVVLSACAINKNIIYLGSLNKAETEAAMQQCTALIFPSICYEGMPMTILEAFALSTPIIASNFGAMESMIINKFNGLLFEVANSVDLGAKLNAWQTLGSQQKQNYQNNALASYKADYAPEKNREQLNLIYSDTFNHIPQEHIL